MTSSPSILGHSSEVLPVETKAGPSGRRLSLSVEECKDLSMRQGSWKGTKSTLILPFKCPEWEEIVFWLFCNLTSSCYLIQLTNGLTTSHACFHPLMHLSQFVESPPKRTTLFSGVSRHLQSSEGIRGVSAQSPQGSAKDVDQLLCWDMAEYMSWGCDIWV